MSKLAKLLNCAVLPAAAAYSLGIGVAHAQISGAGAAGFVLCTQASQGATSLAVSSATADVALSVCGPSVMLQNGSSNPAYFTVGSSTITATTSGYYIAGNSFQLLVVNTYTAQYLAAVSSAGATTTLYINQGFAQ